MSAAMATTNSSTTAQYPLQVTICASPRWENFSAGAWTDWRTTVRGTDPREAPEDDDIFTADVKQCRTFNATTGTWNGDQCPHDWGIDQDIFSDYTPRRSGCGRTCTRVTGCRVSKD